MGVGAGPFSASVLTIDANTVQGFSYYIHLLSLSAFCLTSLTNSTHHFQNLHHIPYHRTSGPPGHIPSIAIEKRANINLSRGLNV
jgi:hypothetical protein